MVTTLIIFLDGLAPLVPLLFWLYYKKAGRGLELRPLIEFLALQFVFNMLANVLAYYPFSNYFVYHIGLPLSFVALLYFFRAIQHQLQFNAALFFAGLLLTAGFMINTLFFETIDTFNSISYAVGSLYVMVVCFRYYWLKATKEAAADLLQEPVFWFISGLFIYFSSSVIVFAAYHNFVRTNNPLAGLSWRFHNVMHLLMCILLSKGIKKYFV